MMQLILFQPADVLYATMLALINQPSINLILMVHKNLPKTQGIFQAYQLIYTCYYKQMCTIYNI